MSHGQCLTEDTITEYLEGALDPVVTAACEVHLIACDRCREGLALYMRVLRTDITPEETGRVDRLTETWDRRKTPAPTPARSKGPRRRTFFLSLASVAAAAVFGV